MTSEELEHIQAVCRGWLRRSDTSKDSRMTIPAGGALSRTIEVKISALLTFDNVLIMSAVDAETGACYTTLIGGQGDSGEFIDTPLDQITLNSTSPVEEQPVPPRATQKRYQDAMERLTQINSVDKGIASGSDTNELWIEKANSEADQLPKYLLYTRGKLLGYSLLERARSAGQRSGRFHPSEEYFEYSHIFANLPEAENDCFEANAREAYGIAEAGDDEYRKRFGELSAQANALKLYVEDEDGLKIEAAEVRLDDLSRHFDDQTERWLYLMLGKSTHGSSSNLIIRRGKAEDAALLAELGARTFSETFAATNTAEDMAAYLTSAFSSEQQAAELADPFATFHIAETDGVAVGYAMIRSGDVPPEVNGDKPIELVRLYVAQESLGRGVGAALMQACVDEAQQRGYETLWLGVWEHNDRAQAFYRKWNFQEVGTHVFQLGDDPQTDILMQRSISE